MRAARRLRTVLARQWIAYGLLLATGFGAMALLLLFLLEDAFIDQRLREVGASVARGATVLPAGFARIARDAAPASIAAATAGQRDGVVREFRARDGRYLHVLAGTDAAGARFLLAYDVTEQLHVNRSLARAWPWLLAIAAVLAFVAWALARRFADRLERRAGDLVRTFADAEAPHALQALAAHEEIAEFATLAALAADAWRERLDAVARERETLAFLGHELRTPLQSARTSLASLHDDRADAAAWHRLERAHARLARASEAILWLAGDSRTPSGDCDAVALLDALVDEFAPLALARGQAFAITIAPDVRWPLTPALASTVAANLLFNAVQHGGAGTIAVDADAAGFVVANPAGEPGRDGFGLGLQIVGRLLARIGGTLESARDEARAVHRVRWRA